MSDIGDIEEEELEEIIERKVQKKVNQELKNRKEDNNTAESDIVEETVEKIKNSGMSRRKFLKTLGLGAGGLALSSQAAAAWSLWQPANKGNSDIDADTVDGKHASDLVASGDFAMESGSFWPGEGKNGVQSISFSNTYVSGAVIGTAAVNPSGRGGDVHDAAGAFNITTTGMDVHYSIDSSDPTNGSVKWTVMGIVDS